MATINADAVVGLITSGGVLLTANASLDPAARSVEGAQVVRPENYPVTLTANGNIKASPGFLGSLVWTNIGATARTFSVINGSGATPVVFPVVAEAGKTGSMTGLGLFFDAQIRIEAATWTDLTVCGGAP